MSVETNQWGAAPGHAEYLGRVAAIDGVLRGKRASYEALALSEGASVLDVGCGLGTDLGPLASLVGTTGRVVGCDLNPEFIARIRAELGEGSNLEAVVGSATALPFADGEFDAVRAERLLQHVPDPAAAMHEMVRVCRDGGRVAVVDSDWGGLMIDAGDATPIGDAIRDYMCRSRVANPRIGRALARLAGEAGLDQVEASASVYTVRDFGTADQLWSLERNAARTVQAGIISEGEAAAWIAAQREATQRGGYLGMGVYIAVCGVRRAPR